MNSNETTAPGWRRYLSLDDQTLLEGCEVDRFRASGPGGQKRNKTDSAVRLRHRATGLEATAVESRSQHENRANALRRLRVTIALAAREPLDVATYTPSEVSRVQMRGARIQVSERNPAYPTLLGEVFDVLEAVGWRLAEAAPALGMSTSTLSKFLEGDPVVFRATNERRAALGMGQLRAARN